MEVKASKDNILMDILTEDVVSLSISVGKRYNSSSLNIKSNNEEYATIYYEWEGKDHLPTFISELMVFLKETKKETANNSDNFYYVNKELFNKYSKIKKKRLQ